MQERLTYQSEQKESEIKPRVGLRLQDVLIRVDTLDPFILTIRERILERLASKPDETERASVLEEISNELLGLSLDESKNVAQRVLIPFHGNGEKRNSFIISSASSSSASQETECAILKARGHLIDIPGAIEGRDTRSAREGDVALISTKSGLIMTKNLTEVKVINLADESILIQTNGKVLKGSDIYYKSDALLLLTLTNPQSEVIAAIVNELAKRSLVCPYNLDEETQIALLWLMKRANISQIEVNANSPEVAVELTRKGYKYPLIEDALKIKSLGNPYLMQTEEWRLSKASLEINYQPDCIPGYVIDWTENPEEMYLKVLASCMLLAVRYDLKNGWIKPDRGTDGGNQGPLEIGINGKTRSKIIYFLQKGNINSAIELYETELSSLPQIKSTAEEMWEKGGSWVVEAKTRYFTIKLNLNGKERVLMTTPSVHIIKGEPRYTISLQLIDGVAWGGNLICSPETWNRLIEKIDPTDERIVNDPTIIANLEKAYPLMIKVMSDYTEAVNRSEKYKLGQVRGGADLAVCTLGGKYGDSRLIIGVQDYNARANGCETAYALYDLAQETYQGRGEAVTRNVTPKVNFEAFTQVLPAAIDEVNHTYGKIISLSQVKLIAISAGWGQIGMIGTDALEILQDILLIEEQLKKDGVIQ